MFFLIWIGQAHSTYLSLIKFSARPISLNVIAAQTDKTPNLTSHPRHLRQSSKDLLHRKYDETHEETFTKATG